MGVLSVGKKEYPLPPQINGNHFSILTVFLLLLGSSPGVGGWGLRTGGPWLTAQGWI